MEMVSDNDFNVNRSRISIMDNTDNYWTKNDQMIKQILWWYVLCASLIGIGFNFFCLWKMTRLKLSQKHRALFSIALANLLALILILIPQVSSIYLTATDSDRFLTNIILTKIYCKTYMFLLHSSTSFATWCWLLLVLIRFTAVFSPFIHFKYSYCNVWLAILLLSTLCCAWDTWTLIAITGVVTVDENGRNVTDCSIDIDFISIETFRKLNVAEIVFSYFAPFVLILTADFSVFCRIYCIKPRGFRRIIVGNRPKLSSNNSPTGGGTSNFGHTNNDESSAMMIMPRGYARKLSRQRRRVFVRLILLTFLNLFLNLPHCVIRLLNTFDGSGWWLPHPYNDIAQKISFALGYTHYALSYVYLQVLIRSNRPRKAVPRHAEFDCLLLKINHQ